MGGDCNGRRTRWPEALKNGGFNARWLEGAEALMGGGCNGRRITCMGGACNERRLW
jgi:hypothetical protein